MFFRAFPSRIPKKLYFTTSKPTLSEQLVPQVKKLVLLVILLTIVSIVTYMANSIATWHFFKNDLAFS